MNKIAPEIIRVKDQLLIKVSISLDGTASEYSYVEFKQGEKLLDIFSTTEGSINNGRVILRKQKSYLEICIEYTSEQLECIIAYMDGNDLLKYQTVPIDVEKLNPIRKIEQYTDIIKTKNTDFSKRMDELHSTSQTRHSSWQLKLEIEKDLKVKVLRSGQAVINVAFGRHSKEPVGGDFIFTLDPTIKNFVIPREVIWRHYRNYGQDARLSIFELVQADFHNVPDVYYKCPISNAVALKQFPKMIDRAITEFTSPSGIYFSSDEWQIPYGLPTRRIDE